MTANTRAVMKSTALYIAYSIVGGVLVMGRFHSAGPKLIDAPLWLSVLAGPSVVLSTTHGLEIYLFASLICLPCVWGFAIVRQPLVKLLLGIAFLLVWGAFGVFLH